MPVFITEVVVRGDIQGERERPRRDDATGVDEAALRARLVDEVTQAVLDRLEFEFDRMTER